MPTPEPPEPQVHPITGAERIEALDVLRGVAVLGILLMNIQSFGSLNAEYMNPGPRAACPAGSELWLWITTHVLADSKFITLFSLHVRGRHRGVRATASSPAAASRPACITGAWAGCG